MADTYQAKVKVSSELLACVCVCLYISIYIYIYIYIYSGTSIIQSPRDQTILFELLRL